MDYFFLFCVLISLGLEGLAGVVLVAGTLLSLVSIAKLYQKAGEKWFKVLIPFYGVYCIYRKFWDTKYYWILLVVTLVTSLIGLAWVGAIVSLIFSIKIPFKLADAFGEYTYGWGMLFLPSVFYPKLAFGTSKYMPL